MAGLGVLKKKPPLNQDKNDLDSLVSVMLRSLQACKASYGKEKTCEASHSVQTSVDRSCRARHRLQRIGPASVGGVGIPTTDQYPLLLSLLTYT